MPARRHALAAVSFAALLLGLTACQQPSPGVTLVSSGSSLHTAAVNFCRDGKYLTKVDGNECPSDGKRVNVLHVRQGDTVGLDVDKALTETGWYLYDLDHQQSFGYEDQHYLSFQADFSNRPVPGFINLEVRQVAHKPNNDQDLPRVLGQWKLQLAQKQ